MKGKPKSGAPSQRQLRAGELVRHALVDVLARGELRDPEVQGVSVIVGEVRASPDLQHMTAFVAPLGGGDPEQLARTLTRCAPFLRGRIAKLIELRHTPQLHFVGDVSYAEASHIGLLLSRPEVRRDLGQDDE